MSNVDPNSFPGCFLPVSLNEFAQKLPFCGNNLKLKNINKVVSAKKTNFKKIPVIRICLPHWHMQKFVHTMLASALIKFEVLPAETWTILKEIFS